MIPEENVDEQFERLIIELQTKLTFQEDTVQALNDIVFEQQQDIRVLKSQVSQLLDELKNIASSLDISGISPEDETPPHY